MHGKLENFTNHSTYSLLCVYAFDFPEYNINIFQWHSVWASQNANVQIYFYTEFASFAGINTKLINFNVQAHIYL